MRLHWSQLTALCWLLVAVEGQRSVLHWKKDLEFRLSSYQGQREELDNIIASSIYNTGDRQSIEGATRVSSGGSVRFSDLIIPSGALVLDPHLARPTVRIMANKTAGYVAAKQNELEQVKAQLYVIRRQVDNQGAQFIYKGAYNERFNTTQRLPGTWIFKDVVYGHRVEAKQVQLRQINFTNVDHVINETYMLNSPYKLLDRNRRLYFEGAKTFWRAKFMGHLFSGCCDRLRPIHTNRVMTRSTNQEVVAPVMFGQPSAGQVVIHNLVAGQLSNQQLSIGLLPNQSQSWFGSAKENTILLHNLIKIKDMNQPEISKTLIFGNKISIDDARLGADATGQHSIGVANSPGLRLDLTPNNYLMRFRSSKNAPPVQRITGTLIVRSESHLLADLNAQIVNNVDLNQFVATSVVRLDRPANIGGSVQFDALPRVLGGDHQVRWSQQSQQPQSVLIMQVDGRLDVNLVNGMRLPQDLVMLAPSPAARPPQEPIYVQGQRHFTNQMIFRDFLQVNGFINGMVMPEGVIPLHLNDVMSSVGQANLWFVDGISARHVTVQSGRFDQLNLHDIQTDAQNLMMRSVISHLPNGVQLIRAPLRVQHLHLVGHSTLNGFRPESLIELQKGRSADRTIYGKKTFLAPVEVTDCWFTDINNLANWTNHLIRIDQPNTVQTIHTRLAFVEPSPVSNSNSLPLSSVLARRLEVQFWPNSDTQHYLNNLNFSPEFYVLHQALVKNVANRTGNRYRVNQVRLMGPNSRINGISVNDVVTLDVPFNFADTFVMVGKVRVEGTLAANRIRSNYPIDALDLVQFDRYRIPIAGSPTPIRLNNLVLASNNQASFLQCQMLNGLSFSQFANSIMSITRPQVVQSSMVFNAQVNFDGIIRTSSSLNTIKDFRQFAYNLKTARLSFEDGLQCNSVMIKV